MINNLDVIILSNTADVSLYGNTQRTINTLRKFSTSNLNIRIVESNQNYLSQGFVYANETVIVPKEPFGYNKFLNYGLVDCFKDTDWVLILNNDLIFTQNWLLHMVYFLKKNPDVRSLSPFEPNWHPRKGLSGREDAYFGYRTSFEITGWCLLIHKEVVVTCNLFDPQFEFWYQDNDYAETIKKFNFKHALVSNSHVYHMVSQSHQLLKEKHHHMTDFQQIYFNNKWK